MNVTCQTSISLIVKDPSLLLVNMFLPPSNPIQKPLSFAHDIHLLSPLNGENAVNSIVFSFENAGPQLA